jgi:phosphomevalonate kinase
VIASAPGKLILTGEYAVLDGAPAIVIAVDRRVVARRDAAARNSSGFLLAVAEEIAERHGAGSPAAIAATEIAVDSAAFYDRSTKLGIGSSAAVTVAATALALETTDRGTVLEVAQAAHARAQGPLGARGSGADIAASVYGGTIVFSRPGSSSPCRVEPRPWPASVALVAFFTGAAADTAQLVAQIEAARELRRGAVNTALTAIADASRAACLALDDRSEAATGAVVRAFAEAAEATDQLAAATGVALVPPCVSAARTQLARLGGIAKTTGAGGGDVAIAVVPATVDSTTVMRLLIEAGCQPVSMTRDDRGVDLGASAS